MPFPNNEQSRGSSSGGKSRRDFSPMDSIDPKCPPSPVGNMDGSVWDTETGMSFFSCCLITVKVRHHSQYIF